MTPSEIEQEGRDYARIGGPARDCPYSFDKSEFWDTKDYVHFETVRWKLDAWMKGWIAERKIISPPKARPDGR